MEVLQKKPSFKGSADRFTGDVWVDMIVEGVEPSQLRVGTVGFTPCARTAWHRHAVGQVLHVMEGIGVAQARGGEVVVMHQGDTIDTPPGEWHWHGAAPDRFMTHLAMADGSGDPSVPDVEWGEDVTDSDYQQAVQNYSKAGDAVNANSSEPAAIARSSLAAADAPDVPAPLTIQQQGNFAVGGSVISAAGTFDPRNPTDPSGQTFHGDHARVFYQVPVNARPLPLVLWHGWWESGQTWGSTPDGRDGFQTIFLRRRFPVYVLDQPRRGGAGKTTVGASIDTTPNEQWLFNQFRLGTWPDLFDGVQFPRGPEALDQFFRKMVPDTGPLDPHVLVDAVSALFDKIGPGILVTHSHAGGFGWLTAMKNRNVRAVVGFEPGSGFVFPEGELPPPMPSSAGTLEGVAVPLADFMALTRIPIVVYYGDNIPTEQTDIAGQDNWRVRLAMARLWVDAVNRRGGDATLVHLPDLGIRGNTHFAFSDLNNVQIADQVSAFLTQKGLARAPARPPHTRDRTPSKGDSHE